MADIARRRDVPGPAHGRTDNVTPLPDRISETGREPSKEPAQPDTKGPATQEAAPVETTQKPKRLRRILLLLGPVLLVAAGIYLYLAGGRFVSTDNAYVRADKLSVATDVTGFVGKIAVKESEKVAEGQLLFRLDDEPYRIALAGAQAQLGTVRNEIATLHATYRQNLAQIEQARTDVSFFEAQFQRQQDLLRKGVSTQAAFDQARRDAEAARERVIVAQRQAEAALAQLGGKVDDRIENNARFQQVKAQVEKAERDLRRTEVRAPMAGIVTNVDRLQVGSYLSAAQPAFNLVATDRVWVEANPKETDLTYLKPGDPAKVTVDAYPGISWQASVASVSPATGAEFSVLPAQNASGNWVKVVQRVPVRLRMELPETAPQLRAGMSVTADIDTGHKRSLGDLVETARRWVGL